MCVYISATEIQTTGLILMKFGMAILLNIGKVHSWVATPYPDTDGGLNGVWPASAASAVWLGENFIKLKLYGIPVLVGADHIFWSLIWIRKDLSIWAIVNHFQAEFIKQPFPHVLLEL
jgi:hypothetical protein